MKSPNLFIAVAWMVGLASLVFAHGGCAPRGDSASDSAATPADDSGTCPPPDAGSWDDAACRFSAPVPLVEVNSAEWDRCPSISSDALTLYFSSYRDGGLGGSDVWVAERGDISAPFGPPTDLFEVNSPSLDDSPWISADGLTLYLASQRAPGASGNFDIFVATRPDPWSGFGTPVHIPEVSSPYQEWAQSISRDELTMYFVRDGPGNVGLIDIYYSRRPDIASAFGLPVSLAELNSDWDIINEAPRLSPDGLTLFFVSYRPGTAGLYDIWYSTRADALSVFSSPVNVSALNTPDNESSPSLTSDGLTVLFWSDRPGPGGDVDIWWARRPCM